MQKPDTHYWRHRPTLFDELPLEVIRDVIFPYLDYRQMPNLRTLVLKFGILGMTLSAHEMKLLNEVQEFLTSALHVISIGILVYCVKGVGVDGFKTRADPPEEPSIPIWAVTIICVAVLALLTIVVRAVFFGDSFTINFSPSQKTLRKSLNAINRSGNATAANSPGTKV